MEKRDGNSCGFKKIFCELKLTDVLGQKTLEKWLPQHMPQQEIKETVNKLLQRHFKDDKTQVSDDALWLMAEFLKVFVREAAARGVRQAQAEDLARVDIEHVEKVLPQLVPSNFRAVLERA